MRIFSLYSLLLVFLPPEKKNPSRSTADRVLLSFVCRVPTSILFVWQEKCEFLKFPTMAIVHKVESRDVRIHLRVVSLIETVETCENHVFCVSFAGEKVSNSSELFRILEPL